MLGTFAAATVGEYSRLDELIVNGEKNIIFNSARSRMTQEYQIANVIVAEYEKRYTAPRKHHFTIHQLGKDVEVDCEEVKGGGFFTIFKGDETSLIHYDFNSLKHSEIFNIEGDIKWKSYEGDTISFIAKLRNGSIWLNHVKCINGKLTSILRLRLKVAFDLYPIGIWNGRFHYIIDEKYYTFTLPSNSNEVLDVIEGSCSDLAKDSGISSNYGPFVLVDHIMIGSNDYVFLQRAGCGDIMIISNGRFYASCLVSYRRIFLPITGEKEVTEALSSHLLLSLIGMISEYII